ncbi:MULTISPECIES: hypothetical protein [Nocardia]|uniref:ATP synthase subunit I n=1 Tax=Nocardia arthritidis TaxID=228602 RepID=A0A6G9YPA1_9NOCA|nr:MULTISPECIES: hypothetical protein [Nocardia]QIS14960.1 hypothetical protein F5544_35650 [Nocardia arthritidis]
MDVNKIQVRRAAIIATVLGILVLMAAGSLDRLLLGIFISGGLAVGWLNAQLTLRAVARIADSDTPKKLRLLRSSAVRLLGITVVAIAVAFLARPNGVGIFFGIALFQVILVLNTVVPELKGLRQAS